MKEIKGMERGNKEEESMFDFNALKEVYDDILLLYKELVSANKD